MDIYWENYNEIEKKVILLLQPKTAYQEGPLPKYWVELFKNSAYIHWINQTDKRYPQVQKISTNEFSRLRDSFAQLIEDKRKVANQYLIYNLTKKVDEVQAI